jgi:hypothetical protein
MGKIRAILESVLNEMAYSRQRFLRRIGDDLLEGAFQEYMCREIALSVGKPDSWSEEVGRILRQIPRYMDPSIVVTTFKDREKALKESFREVSLAQDKVTSAKNKVIGYYPEIFKEILKLKFDSEEEFKKMIIEYLPKYYHLLD